MGVQALRIVSLRTLIAEKLLKMTKTEMKVAGMPSGYLAGRTRCLRRKQDIKTYPDAFGKRVPVRTHAKLTHAQPALAGPKGMGFDANSKQAPRWCFYSGGNGMLNLIRADQGLKLNKQSVTVGTHNRVINHGHQPVWNTESRGQYTYKPVGGRTAIAETKARSPKRV